MCGRIALTSNVAQIKEHFAIKQGSAVLVPRYNIAPNQTVLIIKNGFLEFANWGFKISNSVHSIINARIETVSLKKCFSWAFKNQRCLIVANGFFEWQVVGKQKIPFYIQVKNQPILGFAGIFMKDSCLILTTSTDHSKYDHAFHNRVPVIINANSYAAWFNLKTSMDVLLGLDLQCDQRDFVMHPVSSQVNNPKFDNITCIQALT
jgi:putative SOS response-associated peptidase YedK